MPEPVVLYPDPTAYPPPHGPECPCSPCGRLRRFVGHVEPDELRRRREEAMNPDAFIYGPTVKARSAFAEHMLAFWTEAEAWHRQHGQDDIAARCALWAATWSAPYGETIDFEADSVARGGAPS
jgi:hypothetical protein